MSGAAIATDPMANLEQVRRDVAEHRDSLLPKIRGLETLTKVVHPDYVPRVRAAIDERTRRVGLSEAVLKALDDLTADGYARMPPEEVDDAILADMRERDAEIDTALGEFSEHRTATSLNPTARAEPKQ